MSGNGPPAGRPQGGPVARDQAADVPVEARRPLAGWRLEQPALLGPLLDGLLARQDRLLRQPRPGRAAGGGGAQLGQLPVALGLDGVARLAFGDGEFFLLPSIIGFAGGWTRSWPKLAEFFPTSGRVSISAATSADVDVLRESTGQ
jgi:hypothetical protein